MFLPWKTASQSASTRLMSFDDSPYSKFFYFAPCLNRVVHQHITCAEFACLPESRLGYCAASFVRNPYDRAYSGFRQLQVDIQDQPSAHFPEPWIRDLVMKQLAENRAQLEQADFDFDAWLALVGDEQIYEIGRNSSFPLHPSHYWTHIAGRKVVDFVGRVESFEPDFQALMSLVKIDQVSTVNSNVRDLEGGAATNAFGYRYVDRMNARSVDKINRLFELDFDLFGYQRMST